MKNKNPPRKFPWRIFYEIWGLSGDSGEFFFYSFEFSFHDIFWNIFKCVRFNIILFTNLNWSFFKGIESFFVSFYCSILIKNDIVSIIELNKFPHNRNRSTSIYFS